MSNFESGDALALYNVDRWGGGYFGINADGHVVVKPKRNGEQVDLMEIVREARSR
jgi:arginine decarboxylase